MHFPNLFRSTPRTTTAAPTTTTVKPAPRRADSTHGFQKVNVRPMALPPTTHPRVTMTKTTPAQARQPEQQLMSDVVSLMDATGEDGVFVMSTMMSDAERNVLMLLSQKSLAKEPIPKSILSQYRPLLLRAQQFLRVVSAYQKLEALSKTPTSTLSLTSEEVSAVSQLTGKSAADPDAAMARIEKAVPGIQDYMSGKLKRAYDQIYQYDHQRKDRPETMTMTRASWNTVIAELGLAGKMTSAREEDIQSRLGLSKTEFAQLKSFVDAQSSNSRFVSVPPIVAKALKHALRNGSFQQVSRTQDQVKKKSRSVAAVLGEAVKYIPLPYMSHVGAVVKKLPQFFSGSNALVRNSSQGQLLPWVKSKF